jgi:uncharacterized protein YkwD
VFAPRRTTAARRGAPLLAGLAVGAVLIGAAAVVTPADSTAPALNAALGAPLPPVAAPPPPAATPPPPAPGRPRLTVPAPVAPTPPTSSAAPAPVEEPPVEATPAEAPPTTTPAPPSSAAARPEPEDEPAAPRPRVAGGPVDGVVEATNAERAAAGCDDLRVDLRLAAAAQGHAEDMAEKGYFSHTGQDGREFDERIRAEGHPSPGGENIAQGQETADAVVAAWMDSPGHRRNILDCSFTSIGVGYEADGDHWVQNFGR